MAVGLLTLKIIKHAIMITHIISREPVNVTLHWAHQK